MSILIHKEFVIDEQDKPFVAQFDGLTLFIKARSQNNGIELRLRENCPPKKLITAGHSITTDDGLVLEAL